MSHLFCVQCGEKNDQEARFCSNCGAELFLVEVGDSSKDPVYDDEWTPPPNAQRRWAPLLVALVAVGCLSVFVYWLSNSRQTEGPSGNRAAALDHKVRQTTEREPDLDQPRPDLLREIRLSEGNILHPLGDFVVVLSPGSSRYVKCRVEVEVGNLETGRQIRRREAQFKDTVISVLGSQSYENLRGVEALVRARHGDKSRISGELLARFNRLFPGGQISAVHFTEFSVH